MREWDDMMMTMRRRKKRMTIIMMITGQHNQFYFLIEHLKLNTTHTHTSTRKTKSQQTNETSKTFVIYNFLYLFHTHTMGVCVHVDTHGAVHPRLTQKTNNDGGSDNPLAFEQYIDIFFYCYNFV